MIYFFRLQEEADLLIAQETFGECLNADPFFIILKTQEMVFSFDNRDALLFQADPNTDIMLAHILIQRVGRGWVIQQEIW